MTTTHTLSSSAIAAPPRRPSSVVRGFPDARKGPIPGAPATPAWKGPAGTPKGEIEQRAEALLKKFSQGVVRPDAGQPDTLFAPGRSGRPESMLATFCRAVSAKAHGFLTKVLLPAVESLAQRMDVARPIGDKEPVDWKRAAGGHLIAGADAALRANNPKALEALVPVALKHFPDDVIPFIESRLKRDPATARTFAAAGVDAGTLEGMLARVTAQRAEAPRGAAAAAGPKVEPGGKAPPKAPPAAVRAPGQSSAGLPGGASVRASAMAPAAAAAAAAGHGDGAGTAAAPSPSDDAPPVEF